MHPCVCAAQAVANILAQLGGSCLAAGLLYGVVPNGGGSSLGSNASELAGWCTAVAHATGLTVCTHLHSLRAQHFLFSRLIPAWQAFAAVGHQHDRTSVVPCSLQFRKASLPARWSWARL